MTVSSLVIIVGVADFPPPPKGGGFQSEDSDETVSTLKAELSEGLKEALREMLKQHSDVKGVLFTAYTPYFNDGEPCVFRVEEPAVEFNTDHGITGEYGDEGQFISFWDLDYDWKNGYGSDRVYKTEEHASLGATLQAIKDFLEAIPDEVILDCFGDHVQITATAETITVEKYEHD